MTNELRRKLNQLAKHMNSQYEYDHIAGNKDHYLLIMMFEGQNEFFLTKEDVKDNFNYVDKMFNCYYTGYHPCDIRSVKKTDDDYEF
jgi:hypothetical protein